MLIVCRPRPQTKPHGHGDVHALLHSSGLAAKWKKSGLKWVCFFQVRGGEWAMCMLWPFLVALAVPLLQLHPSGCASSRTASIYYYI